MLASLKFDLHALNESVIPKPDRGFQTPGFGQILTAHCSCTEASATTGHHSNIVIHKSPKVHHSITDYGLEK